MKYLFFLVFSIVINSNIIIAQKIIWSDARPSSTYPYAEKSFEFSSDNALLMGSNYYGELFKLDQNAVLKKTEKNLGKDEFAQCGTSLDHKTCLFYRVEYVNGAVRNDTIYGAFLNENLELSGVKKKLFSVDWGNAEFTKNTYHSISSEDESKFMIYYSAPYQPKGLYKIGVYIGDGKLDKMVYTEFEIPYQASSVQISEFAESIKIDNEGNAYFLIKGNVGSNSYGTLAGEKWNIIYTLIKIDKDGKVSTIPEVDLSDRKLLVYSATLNVDNNLKKVEIIGTALDTKFQPQIFVYSLNNNDYQTYQLINFPKEITAGFEFGGDLKKEIKSAESTNNMPPWTYRIKQIVPDRDGGILVFAEQHLLTTGFQFTYDILIFKILKNNEIAWFSKIPKRDHNVYYGYSYQGFNTAITEGKIYVLFDSKFDVQKAIFTNKPVTNSGEPLCYTIGKESGNILSKKILYDKKEAPSHKGYFLTTISNSILCVQMYSPSFGGSLVYKYGVIKFE